MGLRGASLSTRGYVDSERAITDGRSGTFAVRGSSSIHAPKGADEARLVEDVSHQLARLRLRKEFCGGRGRESVERKLG